MSNKFRTTLFLLLVSITLQGVATTDVLTIGFAGDVMLGRLTNNTILKTSYRYPWGNLLSPLHSNDLNIINLETTLTNYTKPVPKVFNFRADPKVVTTLKEGAITVANTANNHILDFGLSGLVETLQTLDNASILHMGSGNNEHEARKPIIIRKNGLLIGIIGATDNEPTWKATASKPGTNYVDIGQHKQLLQDVQAVRPLVDVLVVSLHWGPNMRQRPTEEFRTFAHELLDAGADILHGHSAHIFQGIEIYNQKLILYDTGDFVDDYAIDPILKNDQSFLFVVIVSKAGVEQVQLIPVVIKNMQVNKAVGTEAKTIIQRMQKLSQEFGTTVSSDGHISVQTSSARL